MSSPLNILAFEPFYGGCRRRMLETLLSQSHHHWRLLKLPPRRLERRLATSVQWFAEQLARHRVGPVDLILVSDLMNLAELHRTVPTLATKPSVVYFHDNQLPRDSEGATTVADLVNITSGLAATQLWFNAQTHLEQYFARAEQLIAKHPDLASRNPLAELRAKSVVVPPPIALDVLTTPAQAEMRDRRRLLFATRDADMPLLQAAFDELDRRGETVSLAMVGSGEPVDSRWSLQSISNFDDAAIARTCQQSGVVLSTHPAAAWDHLLLSAMASGCWPVATRSPLTEQWLPQAMQGSCLVAPDADAIASRIQDYWHLEPAPGWEQTLHDHLRTQVGNATQFDQALVGAAMSH